MVSYQIKNNLKKFIKEETNERPLSKGLINIIKNMPKKSHPMDVARTAGKFYGFRRQRNYKQ